jgi:hypothetical protein
VTVDPDVRGKVEVVLVVVGCAAVCRQPTCRAGGCTRGCAWRRLRLESAFCIAVDWRGVNTSSTWSSVNNRAVAARTQVNSFDAAMRCVPKVKARGCHPSCSCEWPRPPSPVRHETVWVCDECVRAATNGFLVVEPKALAQRPVKPPLCNRRTRGDGSAVTTRVIQQHRGQQRAHYGFAVCRCDGLHSGVSSKDMSVWRIAAHVQWNQARRMACMDQQWAVWHTLCEMPVQRQTDTHHQHQPCCWCSTSRPVERRQ